MSSSGFSFPPPPPPPPPSSGTNFAPTNSGQQQYGGRGGRNNFRGRGRGSGHRGGGRGGLMKDSGPRGGFGPTGGSHPPPMHSNPYYASHSQPAYSTHSSYAPQHTPYGQQQQPQSQHNAGEPSHGGFQSAAPRDFTQTAPPAQYHGYRGGFTSRGQSAHFSGPQKRPHQNAFGHSAQKNAPRPSAPLPVPSFGNPLPSKPLPAAPDSNPKPTKKRRTFNQLGLTPKTEDHESSEEEEEVDEEAKFAAQTPSGGSLTINYKGRTSTLRSQEDIAKWIEERRQRFPTQARVDERLKEAEAKKAKSEAIKREKDAAREELKRLAKEKRDKERGDKKGPEDSAAATSKAELRAQKLRSKLQKQEMKIAKAEAKLARARSKTTTAGSMGTTGETERPDGQDETAQDPQPDIEGLEGRGTAEDEDETSSSGSDASSSDDSDSDDDDDDSLPEEMTSKRQQPERVLPPPRQDPRQGRVCHQYVKTGRCRRGRECPYPHEKPAREAPKPSQKTTPAAPEKRKTLFQTLLAQQREEENERIMRAISWLGERGILDDDDPPQEPAS